MPSTVRELAALVGGEVHGDGDLPIHAARSLRDAAAGHITFADNDRHLAALHDCPATAAVVPPAAPANGKALIRAADPLAAFIAIARHLHARPEPPPHGIDPHAQVHPTATVGPDASVYAYAVVGPHAVVGARCCIHSGAVVGGHCRVGDDVTLHANVVLYEDTVLGDRVIVHANAVVGADGFGYRLQGGRHVRVPQLGHVEVGDDVEIGACATIDRGTFGPTRIGSGTKIDNLVMVGHNCQIGEHNVLVSQVGLAGSCETGAYVIIAGQAGIADHLCIGTGAIIGAQAGVTKDVAPNQRVLGSPATPGFEQKRMMIAIASVPDLRRRLQVVEKHLGLRGGADE
jgi:UDP-3-O-[3-hydroxymyristoyl] glucosamine N-acyltransferase